MKHVVKIFSLLVAISGLWIGLLQASIISQSHTWLVRMGQISIKIIGFGSGWNRYLSK
ncbi:hypothetical protein QQP08_001194 [Theobroma cacao]|nr:hypothetical protein QQP08_001194 [Theobroma cacao]